MISEQIVKAIDKEGEKKGFYMESAGGIIDDKGFKFVIVLRHYQPPPLGISTKMERCSHETKN